MEDRRWRVDGRSENTWVEFHLPSSIFHLVGVYLRPLQLPAEIDVPDLRLTVELIHLPPAFAVSVPCLFDTAERQMGLCADRGSIDVRDAVVQFVECAERNVHVLRVDRRRKTITNIVGHAEGRSEE